MCNLPKNRQLIMAEREGFEPSIQFDPYTFLAGKRFQPLSHLSVWIYKYSTNYYFNNQLFIINLFVVQRYLFVIQSENNGNCKQQSLFPQVAPQT